MEKTNCSLSGRQVVLKIGSSWWAGSCPRSEKQSSEQTAPTPSPLVRDCVATKHCANLEAETLTSFLAGAHLEELSELRRYVIGGKAQHIQSYSAPAAKLKNL